jgi:transglutaminase-like putative cysteine protease
VSASTVSCLLTFEVSEPAVLSVQVVAARRAGLDLGERLEVINNTVPVTAQEIVGSEGGREHLIRARPGTLVVTYEATVVRTRATAPEPASDAQRVAALRPSRYCPSDRMAGFARSHFDEVPAGLDRVRAICDYVWRHVGYEATTSGPSTDAVETLLNAHGVCRDFAHLVAALCRAVEVPARVAAVYAPGLSPMDFHAVVETAINGQWYAWDATRSAPRSTLVRIGTGRDAADVAFSTVISGRAELSGLQIGAVAAADLPLDDHHQLVALG